jgi:predicted nucleotidyltransferase
MESFLKTYFSKKPEIVAAYLFGSQVENQNQPNSDVDIGILLRQADPEKTEILRKQVIVDLSRILRKDIHPVIMNSAGEELLRQILSKGKCIQINDSKFLAHFMIVALCKIAEFGYYRNIIRKGFVRSVLEASHG